MNVPVKKNDDITLEISGMTAEGAGVGRKEGFAVFVPGALENEIVRVHIIKVTSTYAVGKLIDVIYPSPFRIAPLCPASLSCGGCCLQHMSYEAQLIYKRRIVKDALERIGGFSGIDVNPVIGMEDPLRYRNKGSFPFANIDGVVRWGLYAPRSHRLICPDDCIIENPAACAAANTVADWANMYSIPAYDEQTGKGILRHVVTRSCTGGDAICIVTAGKLPHRDSLIEMLRKAVPCVRSIVHNINDQKTNVILGGEFKTIWGEDTVCHAICGSEFSVSAESFLQVNTKQTEKLYSLAVEGLKLTGNEEVADLFCGIGTISLLIAKHAKRVTGIEYVKRAVDDARRNAKLNGLTNTEFYAGPAEEILPRLIAEGRKFDSICLDPPRKGAEKAVLEAIAACGTERVTYVSCDPATLARDLKLLCTMGYSIENIQPVDMFPFSHHVESVVQLIRQ